MNKRQTKKKNKNQFDEYCRNYKQRKQMKKNIERAKQMHRFEIKTKTVGEEPWCEW